MADTITEFTSAIRTARQHVRMRLALLAMLQGIPKEKNLLGYFAELVACVKYNWAPWNAISTIVRKRIHRGGSPGDRGIDAVGENGEYVQVKWYELKKTAVTSGAVCKLLHLTDKLKEENTYPVTKTIFVIRDGTNVAIGLPPADRERLEIVRMSDADIKEISDTAIKEYNELAGMFELARGQASPEEYDAFQEECAEALWTKYANGIARPLTVKLPTGTGKSFLIAKMAVRHLDETPGYPVVIMEPRLDIIREMEDLLSEKCPGRSICVVDGKHKWTDGKDIYLVSGASADKIPRGIEVSACILDEAHNGTGHKAVENIIASAKYYVSATLEGKGQDCYMPISGAVGKGFICDTRFVFAAFPRPPTHDDIVRHLMEHPEHRCIMACFQEQKNAQSFAAAYNAVDPGQACTYVSDDGKSDALDRFRNGDFRILCVVTRVEMGINAHKIDTILMAEPWKTDSRVVQLCGRGARWHPSKPNYYTVLQCIGPDPSEETEELVKISLTMQDDNLSAAMGKVEVIDGLEPRDQAVGDGDQANNDGDGKRTAGAIVPPQDPGYVLAVRHTVYDRLGNVLNGNISRLEVLRQQYENEKDMLRRVGITNKKDYDKWREDHKEFPEDLGKYGELVPVPKWPDFFGRKSLSLEEVQCKVRLALSKSGIDEGQLEAEGLEAIYKVLCKIDPDLPKDPEKHDKWTLAQVFAAV